MKILFFIHRFPGYGGIETVTTVLANYFFQEGNNVSIISYLQENEELLEKLNEKIPLFRFPDQQDMFSVDNINFLYNTISEFQPDFLINQESYSKLFELVIKIKAKISCKIITVEHNTPDARHKMYINYLRNEKLKFNVKSILKKLFQQVLFRISLYNEKKDHRVYYQYSDTYILLSEKFIPIFKKISGLRIIDKIKSIENPVTIKPPLKVTIKNKEKIVLYVGRLDYGQKHVDRLVKIFGKIFNNVPDWKLMIVGDGPDRPQIENYVKEHNILNIAFEGVQTNVEKYYFKAAILCLTSNIEGWPLVLTEAMAFGCVPILYNSFASAPDIVDDGINGRLIKPFDENSYSNALLQLILNKEERENLAIHAIKYSARFSLEKVGDKWQQLLKY